MRLVLLTSLVMVAFAANSVLNRMALASGGMDAVAFGAIRLIAGALMLAGLCAVLRRESGAGGGRRVIGVAALLVYIAGFSGAYETLDAGLGALILFGMVQVTMFAVAWGQGEHMPARRWIGAWLALVGLFLLVWPGQAVVVSPLHAGLMAAAGIGWGVYSLNGRGAGDALRETASNFLWAAGIAVVPALWLGEVDGGASGRQAMVLAVICGALTSGLGYALWYRVLPRLSASIAAVAQLTVPVIALAGGVIFLSEDITLRLICAAMLVLGGVAVSVRS